MTVYSAESFLRATIRQSTASNQSVPYTLKVSKIPNLTNWLLTISPNTSNEEIIEYDGVDWSALTITVVKNWINPSSQLLTTNWVDYNNPTYIKAHSQNDVIRGDVNHIHINQASSNSTLATNLWVGISKLSVAAANPADPIVVWTNDPRLTNNFAVGRIDLTSATTVLTTYTLWFRPKVIRLSATRWSTTWPMSTSTTYDWGSTYTIYLLLDETTSPNQSLFRHDTQNWTAVLLRNTTGSNLINITTVAFTSTWFTLSAPSWTWYTACSITYEAFA